MFDWNIADRETHRLTVARALGRHVRRASDTDYTKLSERTGIKLRTLKSYGQGSTNPTYDNLVRLMRELPEDFADEVLRPANLGGVTRLTNEAPCDMKLLALMTGASSEISEAYATTGRVCHVRWPKVRAKLADAFRHIGARLRQTEARV